MPAIETRLSRRAFVASGFAGGILTTLPAESQTGSPTMEPTIRVDSARMVVIYKTPKDVAAFERHYFATHIPLAKNLPGLRKYEVSQGPIVTPHGASDFHFVATLHFDDLAAIKGAFATPAGQLCAADRRNLAPDPADFFMLLFDSQEA
jgi:uncharacterized protein (TIGR02118 family)